MDWEAWLVGTVQPIKDEESKRCHAGWGKSKRPQFPASLRFSPAHQYKMLFGKVLLPVFALFSVVIASPIAAPAPEANALLVKRADPVTSAVQTLSDSALPLISVLTPAAATVDAQVDAIVALFVKAKVDILGLVNVDADVDVTAIIDLNVNLIVKLLVALNVFGLLDLSVFAKIDAALSAYLNALVAIQADLAVKIGKGIPLVNLNLFVNLKLILSATVLGVLNILGIIGL
ncbi:hypothetical protein EIP91_008222 [Steccherinum ochraceum]|uniref:Transmembrane protein n=1 Tax=Steccherinum ochraceum TaxID=92696 RepID=A0A4V2MXA3_9APHY|nr:hypothetical protein EIP91_008222 [Steccherinum ochraceum]